MKYPLSLQDESYLPYVLKIPFEEIILHSALFSKTGNIHHKKLDYIIDTLCENGKKVIFLWDILCSNSKIKELSNRLKTLSLEKIYAFRFLDPGVGEYLKNEFPNIPVQISLERNAHNLNSIQQWIHYFKPQINRVILSNELPISWIKKNAHSIPVELELLSIGRLELFYSPRSLLKSHFSQIPKNSIEVEVESKERPALYQTALENQQGTFLFYEKDLFILHQYKKMHISGVSHCRLELYQLEQFKILSKALNTSDWQETLKQNWNSKNTKGFFRTNKNDASFSRLTNKYLQIQPPILGTVIESVKYSHLILKIESDHNLPLDICIYTPEGNQIFTQIMTLHTLKGLLINDTATEGYYYIPWIHKVVIGSILKLLI